MSDADWQLAGRLEPWFPSLLTWVASQPGGPGGNARRLNTTRPLNALLNQLQTGFLLNPGLNNTFDLEQKDNSRICPHLSPLWQALLSYYPPLKTSWRHVGAPCIERLCAVAWDVHCTRTPKERLEVLKSGPGSSFGDCCGMRTGCI